MRLAATRGGASLAGGAGASGRPPCTTTRPPKPKALAATARGRRFTIVRPLSCERTVGENRKRSTFANPGARASRPHPGRALLAPRQQRPDAENTAGLAEHHPAAVGGEGDALNAPEVGSLKAGQLLAGDHVPQADDPVRGLIPAAAREGPA